MPEIAKAIRESKRLLSVHSIDRPPIRAPSLYTVPPQSKPAPRRGRTCLAPGRRTTTRSNGAGARSGPRIASEQRHARTIACGSYHR